MAVQTAKERAEKAAFLKSSGECNCAQSVLKVFQDKLNLDDSEIMRIGAGFAAGMGSLESTCGALIGSVIAAGILSGGKGTVRIANRMLKSFNEKSGATICKDLKGIGSGKVLCECKDCVYNAVEILCGEMNIA